MPVTLKEKIDLLQGYVGYLQQYTGHQVPLTQADLTTLAEMMIVRNYSRRYKLVSIGEKEQYMHFILKGLARRYFYRGKEEVVVQLAKEGDMICSSVSFFSEVKSDYVVEVIEPTLMLSLPRSKFDQLLKYSIVMNRLARVIQTEFILATEERELNRLKYSIRERFLQFVENNLVLFLRVPHKFQASYLDIKPETFSRLKAQVASKVRAISQEDEAEDEPETA